MEWVETTGKTLDEAKEQALDRLGIGPEDAEFEVLEEPRTGLFGRMRGEARVRARVRPATVRPKQDRRNRRRDPRPPAAVTTDEATVPADPASGASPAAERPRGSRRRGAPPANGHPVTPETSIATLSTEESGMSEDSSTTDEYAAGPGGGDPVEVAAVAQAAEEFSAGLVDAFGLQGTATSTLSGSEIDVRIDGHGDGLGLLIGPGGRTLLAIQDLARVAAQRRLGDHDTRLRIDIAGYREKRRVALERFSRHVAELVKESGIARSLDPMPSADRKVVHDTLATIDGVATRSEGEDPFRRIIVTPG